MQVENDYDEEVWNGDIGFITAVDTEEAELAVDFDDLIVSYGVGELDALVPACATTIHKSQGSEYPAVVMPVMTQHFTMLQRSSTPASPGGGSWWSSSASRKRSRWR